MPSLQFSNMAELKVNGELDPELRKKFHKVTCERAFESYLSLFKQAVRATAEPENQYIYYARCGELGKMIMQKNGFQQFTKKQELFDTFKTVLSQMETVEAMLTKAYQQKKEIIVAPDLPEVPPSVDILKIPEMAKVKVTIQPRELLRAVEQEKKSAVILDFRTDQTKKMIQYTKGAIHQVTVIPIPRDLVNPGLLFHALKLRLPTGHRPYLSRIQSSDYVVIMEDEGSELIEDRPLPSTKAGILQLALTEYNPTEKLKCRPLFMEGGFKKWNLQYPTYVHNTDQDVFVYHDALESMIANYRKPQLSVEYPEFSPRRVAVEKPPEEPAVVPGRESITPPVVPSPSPDSIAEPQEVFEPVSSLSQLPHRPPVPERTTKPAEVPPTEPKSISPAPTPIVPEPSNMAPRLAGGQSDREGVSSIGSSHPSVDRGKKPGEVSHQPIASAYTPTPSKPSLDRTTKPSLQITAQERHQLLGIYQMMAENIAENAVKRGGTRPGQTGLYNMGNTCFMNACLQALFQTPSLVDVFTRDYFTSKVNTQNPLGTSGVISAVFSALVDNAWSGEFNAFKPQRFLAVFAKEVNSMLTNGQQQDASEFYMMFLASLHEDTNQVLKGTPPVTNYTGGANIRKEAVDFDRKQSQYNYSPISRILHPRTVSEVTCSTCRAQSVTFDDVNIIQVGLPPPSMDRVSLVDCLHKSFSSTNLDGRWNCPSCKTARPASQKISLWNLSPVIVVHLLRFSFTGGDYVKNDISVQFDPDHLDMKPFLHASADRTVESSYKLYSVTNHRGRLNSGHYTAYSRHLKSGEWLRFDDETVSPGRSSDINYSDAYILYFKRKGL